MAVSTQVWSCVSLLYIYIYIYSAQAICCYNTTIADGSLAIPTKHRVVETQDCYGYMAKVNEKARIVQGVKKKFFFRFNKVQIHKYTEC